MLSFASYTTAQEQVHLTLTGIESEMHVSWAESTGTCSSSGTVTYGINNNNNHHHNAVDEPLTTTQTVSGSSYLYKTGMGVPLCLWDATMTGLKPNTPYTYTISNSGSSTIMKDITFNFTSAPDNQRNGGKIYAVYADLGMLNDISLAQIVAEGSSGMYDMVLHSGDLAYDLNTALGTRGNDYLNALQPAAATVPYIVCPGNHEHWMNFSQYKARFYGFSDLAKNSGSDNLMYYSFNDDLVHFTTIDTEIYHYCNGTATLCDSQVQAQLDWLEADLAKVDRTQTPWIIVLGHKQGWMDALGSGNWSKISSILEKYAVDLYLLGHQHNYQRTLPFFSDGTVENCYSDDLSVYTDCKAMVSVVVGSPGCREKISQGSAPTKVSAKLILAYGFAKLQIHNASHMHFTWEEIAAEPDPNVTGRYTKRVNAESDDLWIIKSSH